MRNSWRPDLGAALNRLRHEGRTAFLWSARITVAAVASYVVAVVLFPDTEPLLAPLTAMLVVQVTPVSLLASGVDRVVAVVAGVLVAVGFAAVVPLEWWSLALVILCSLVIGQVLRLRANQIEVAISAMLVLGVGTLGAESAAWQRITETLVGAAVGVVTNLLFPPRVATDDAGRAIDGLADSVAALLDRAAEELPTLVAEERDVAAAARHWLGQARLINHDIPRVGAALLHAEQGRRLNVRAVGTADVGPGLRQGLEALEHSTVAVRGMFRALVDATADSGWPPGQEGQDLARDLAGTFREMAAGFDAFGQLVHDEAQPARSMSAADVQGLRAALEGLHQARARLDGRVATLTEPALLELHAVVLATVKRLLREMDLAERIRRELRLLMPPSRTSRARPPAPGEPRWEPGPDEETQVLPEVPTERRPGRPRPDPPA